MAKARVYELAKELGLTNEDLLERLYSMGLHDMTHMSSLEEDQILEVRQEIGVPEPKDFVDKRVGTTIIRRRRKSPKKTLQEEAVTESQAVQGETEISSETPLKTIESVEEQIETQEAAAEISEPEKIVEREVKSQIEEPIEPIEKWAQDAKTVEEEPIREAVDSIDESKTQDEGEAAIRLPGQDIPSKVEEEKKPIEEKPIAEVQEGKPEIAELDKGEKAEPVIPSAEQKSAGEKDVKAAQHPVETVEEEPKPIIPGKKIKTPKKPKREAKKTTQKRARKKDQPARIIKMPEPEMKTEESEVSETPIAEKKGAIVVPLRPEQIAEKEAEAQKVRPKKKKAAKKSTKVVENLAEPSKPGRAKKKSIVERDDLYDAEKVRSFRAKKGSKSARRTQKTEITVPKAIKRRVKMASDTIVVAELAKKMGIKAGELVKKLFTLGMMANLNQAIDFDTASLIANEFGYEVEREAVLEEELLAPEKTMEEKMVIRPPVITVMGHVDHGKTTLLDAIRKTNVVEGEAGGITQHIGAYHVKINKGSMTFIDTPGHEAFTSMRARGAKVTDIVILIVAADDGVMQQTKEAIDHAKAAAVPIIVAVNKIDKSNADPDRVKRELAEYGVVPEEWGGDTVMIPISAKENKGIDDILEYVLLQSELLELKADPTAHARGTLIEARLDKGRGPVATVLVQSGTLKVGDTFICGLHSGRVRAMSDDRGNSIREAGPSIPVEVQGASGVPNAGDSFIVLDDEKAIKQLAEKRQHEQRVASLYQGGAMTLEKLQERIQEGESNELNVLLKADVQGSVEALVDALQKLGTSEISLNAVSASAGAISENDVMLASASNAIIVGFNVRPTAKVRKLAKSENVELRLYDVIYDVINDIKEAMAGRLEPTYEEKVLGQAEVRELFKVSKVGTIAGCTVTDGAIKRSHRVRVIREGVVVAEGQVDSLKRFKDDAREVAQGFECGINISNFNDVKVGDIIESYMLEEIKPSLD